MPYQHLRPVETVAFSITKAAAATGLSHERLARAAREGSLRTHRVGTKTRVTARALADWIESHPRAFRNRPQDGALSHV